MDRAQAAAAADLALMWRRRVYGESVDGQPYNFPYDVYLRHARAAVRQLEACRTAEVGGNVGGGWGGCHLGWVGIIGCAWQHVLLCFC